MAKANLSPIPPPIKEDIVAILKGKIPPVFKHLLEQNQLAIKQVATNAQR